MSTDEYRRAVLNGFCVPHLNALAKQTKISLSDCTNSAARVTALVGLPVETIEAYAKATWLEECALSDAELMRVTQELARLSGVDWGVVQGGLDRAADPLFRKRPGYDEMESQVTQLAEVARGYYRTKWYNQLTSDVIEDHFFRAEEVIPVLKRQYKGIDFFYQGLPWDLKITYVPRGWATPSQAYEKVVAEPLSLVQNLYDEQGEARFGVDPRFFIVLVDKSAPNDSWKLRRDFPLVFGAIDAFIGAPQPNFKLTVKLPKSKTTVDTTAHVLLVTEDGWQPIPIT